VTGEAMHQKGADGARRAKKWLDATTRVSSSWTNEDEVHAARLEFNWPYGEKRLYSFDVGGILSGEEFNGRFFVAECKNYSGSSNQGTHFDDFVAKCYLTRRDHYRIADHFMWITWHPFRQETWTSLCSVDAVTAGLLKPRNRNRALGVAEDDEGGAKAAIDQKLVADVAARMWMIVLSEKQESLVITPKHRALILAKEIEEAG
jgi:hypothetical protein